MNSLARAWFYPAVLLISSTAGFPGFAAWFFLSWVASEIYLRVKVAMLTLGGFRVRSIQLGVPALSLLGGSVRGIPIQYGILPIFPFLSIDPKRQMLSGAQRFRECVLILTVNIVSIFGLIALLATAASVWSWNLPRGRSEFTVFQVRSNSIAAQRGLQPGDQLLLARDLHVTSRNQIKDDTGLLFWGTSGFSEVPGSLVRTAILKGDVTLSDRPIPHQLRIDEVRDESLAWNHGIQTGDIIERVDGTPVYRIDDLMYRMRLPTDSLLKLEISRDGQVLDPVSLPTSRDNGLTLGVLLDVNLKVTPRPIHVVGVDPSGPAAAAGVAAGDWILSVDGVPVQSVTDFRRRTAKKLDQAVVYTLLRGSQFRTLSVLPKVMSGPSAIIGISMSADDLGRMGVLEALSFGSRYAVYSATLPFQMIAQSFAGQRDPHGVYGTWSELLSEGVPAVQRGEAIAAVSSTTWGGVVMDLLKSLPTFLLSAFLPVMVVIEYFCSAKLMIAAFPRGWVRFLILAAIVVAIITVTCMLVINYGGVIPFEIPSTGEQIWTARSLWRF